jgi:ABC-type nitrate/sulfonate/bicarbonate transport system substrate-binding protein
MALLQRPLAAVIAQPAIKTPRELEGHKIGVTGLASDNAVLDSVVAGAGADPHKVRTINIGFEAVPSLLARRVDAATAFWDVEGVALTSARPGIKEFRVDEYGAPAYPELVLCASRAEVEHEHAFVEKVVHAIQRGYALTVRDPAASEDDLLREVPGLNRATIAAQLRVLRRAFVAAGGHFGELNLARLRSWASWEAHFGIVPHPPQVSRLFDPSFAG